MAIVVTAAHSTAADATFSASGATAWNASQPITFTGLTANALLLSDGTDLTQSANLTWGPTAGQGLTMDAGTAVSAVSAMSLTGTINFATTAINWIDWSVADTSSHASTLIWRVRGGASGTSAFASMNKGGLTAFAALCGGGVTSTGTDATLFANYLRVTLPAAMPLSWSSTVNPASVASDTWLGRISATVIGSGTAAGNSLGTFQGKHNSSDGTAGVSGTGSTITCKDGIITAIS